MLSKPHAENGQFVFTLSGVLRDMFRLPYFFPYRVRRRICPRGRGNTVSIGNIGDVVFAQVDSFISVSPAGNE